MVSAPTILVANLGMADSLILMVMALVVFGPRRLPQIGRQIGKLMYEFRKASNDFKFQMEEELRTAEEADRRKKEEEERQHQLAANPPAQIEAGTTSTETPAVSSEPVSDAPLDPRDPYAYTYGELTEEELRVQPTYPSIQPPSTGELIPANHPTADASAGTEPAVEPAAEGPANEQAPHEQSVPEIATDTRNSAVEDADKTIESATHNG